MGDGGAFGKKRKESNAPVVGLSLFYCVPSTTPPDPLLAIRIRKKVTTHDRMK
jgi:hypothetical protein